jgi:hypothetical protein
MSQRRWRCQPPRRKSMQAVVGKGLLLLPAAQFPPGLWLPSSSYPYPLQLLFLDFRLLPY